MTFTDLCRISGLGLFCLFYFLFEMRESTLQPYPGVSTHSSQELHTLNRYDKNLTERHIFESSEWSRFDEEVAAAQLICEHAQELRAKEVEFSTAPTATIQARIAYNTTRQVVKYK